MKMFGNISLNCDYQRVYCVYEQMLKLHGTAGRLVSHILLRLMQLIRYRLLVYCHMTLEGREVGLSVSLCGGTPAWHTSHRDKIVLLDHSTMLSNPIMYHCVRSGCGRSDGFFDKQLSRVIKENIVIIFIFLTYVWEASARREVKQ